MPGYEREESKKITRQKKKPQNKENRQWRIWKQKLYREKKYESGENTSEGEEPPQSALLQHLQEERKKLDNQIQSRSDLLKNLEASQRVDRILELYYQN